jgi:hypothetical protein
MMIARLVLATAAATAGLAAAAPSPAAADPACVSAQASGLFAVVHAGPVCVETLLPTTTTTESVSVGVETVTVTLVAP